MTTAGPVAAGAGDITNNETMRIHLQVMMQNAAKLAEAIEVAEALRAQLEADAVTAGEAAVGNGFDIDAATAVQDVVDTMTVSTLSEWHGKADAARGALEKAHGALNKYLDAEDLVAAGGADGRTLNPTR